jgi:hypothetical protein
VRRRWEQRLGSDFGLVRIHDDAEAHALSESLGAVAYTLGHHIVFGPAADWPEAGFREDLLRHELEHIGQQRKIGPRIQRQPQASEGGTVLHFAVQIDPANPPASDEDLILEFIRQYRRLRTIEEARALRPREAWAWTAGAHQITPAERQRGYVLLRVRDRGLQPLSRQQRAERREYLGSLPGGDQSAINDEIDRRFWERTQYRPGQRLGASPQDREMAGDWLAIRDDVVGQRQAIDNLPPEVRAILFQPGGPAQARPADFGQILRIAGKLQTLTPGQLEDYAARTTTTAVDWNQLEASVDRYLAEQAGRRAMANAREAQMTQLTGLEPQYEKLRHIRAIERASAMSASAGMAGVPVMGGGIGGTMAAMRLREELTRDLASTSFPTIDAFAAAAERYELAFRRETVALAREALDRYEHLLVDYENRYRNPAGAAALQSSVVQSGARGHYEAAEQASMSSIRAIGTRESVSDRQLGEATRQAGIAREETAAAERAMTSASTEHPVLTGPRFPAERLARANPDQMATITLEYIAARRDDVRRTRANLASNSEMVYRLDVLMTASKAAQDIAPRSIFDMIIADHQSSLAFDEALIGIALAVLGIALGLVTAGGGTVGLIAAAGAFGLGAYGAVTEFARYERMHAAHGTGLLSDDPSFAWVIVAVVGAGLDLAAVTTAFRTARGLRPAVETFTRTGDISTLRRDLDAVAGLDARLKSTIVDAAAIEAAERARGLAVIREWFPTGAARASFFGVDLVAELSVRVTFAAYLTVRRGIRSFRRFLQTSEAQAMIGRAAGLSPTEVGRIRSVYETAIGNVDMIINHGRSLGIPDAELDYFFRLWARNPQLEATVITRQMDAWVASLGGRTRLFREAPEAVLGPESRALLPDFERRIAGTGGIESITARRPPGQGLAVTIEGEVRQSLVRDPRRASAGDRIAPSFNTSRSNLLSNRQLGLSNDWEVLHLWGPGFGDEAAAGMMRGPRAVNHVWQNQSVEAYIRELAAQARREGGTVRLRATAVAWETPTPRGWTPPAGEHFLKQAEYRITIEIPGRPPQPVTVTIDVAEPPAAALLRGGISIDPPGAANPASLFPVR